MLNRRRVINIVIAFTVFLTVKLPFVYLGQFFSLPILICVGSSLTACFIYVIKLRVNSPSSQLKYYNIVKLAISAFIYSLILLIIPSEYLILFIKDVIFPSSSMITYMLPSQGPVILSGTIPALGIEVEEWQSAKRKFIDGVFALRERRRDLKPIVLGHIFHLDELG